MGQSIFKTISDGWDHVTSNPIDFISDVGKTARDKTGDWLTNPGKALADGLSDVFTTTVKTTEDVAAPFVSVIKHYWYVPVIIGGVYVGYKIVGKTNTAKLTNAALAAIAGKQN